MTGELIDLVPLVRGELSDIRYDLHKSMVLSIISDMNIEERINIEDMRIRTIKKFNINDFPREVLSKIMSELEDDNQLRKDGSGYSIDRAIERQSIDVFIDNCYGEFKKVLERNIKDFDRYIDKEFEAAFKESLFYIIETLVDEQSSTSNINLDNLKYDQISIDLRNYLLKYKTIKNKDNFLCLFYDYLKSGDKSITDLLFKVYQVSVSFDLLKRGRFLPRIAEQIGEGGILFLDTNVIVSLMCNNDRTYDLAKSVIELANAFHFKIGYGSGTAKEYENLLKWADAEMKSKHLPNKIVAENQLVMDFTKRTSCKWSDYYTELSMYQGYLRNDFNIGSFEDYSVELNEKEMEIIRYIDAIYSYALGSDEKKDRSHEALLHDKNLFQTLIYLKRENNGGLNTPWILSFDNILNNINQTLINFNKLDIPEGGYSIHPRTLLNTLLVFTNIDFDEKRRRDFVKSIVNYMIIPSSAFTEEQYAKLIAYKVPGLSEKDIETILYFFRLNPLKSQLDKALVNKDIDSASQTFREMMVDPKAVETLLSETKTKEENERLKKALKELRLEKEALERRQSDQTLYIKSPEIDLITRQLVIELLSEIKKWSPETYAEKKLDELESKELSKDKLRSVVTTINECLGKGSEVATKLKPMVDLLSAITNLIGS